MLDQGLAKRQSVALLPVGNIHSFLWDNRSALQSFTLTPSGVNTFSHSQHVPSGPRSFSLSWRYSSSISARYLHTNSYSQHTDTRLGIVAYRLCLSSRMSDSEWSYCELLIRQRAQVIHPFIYNTHIFWLLYLVFIEFRPMCIYQVAATQRLQ